MGRDYSVYCPRKNTILNIYDCRFKNLFRKCRWRNSNLNSTPETTYEHRLNRRHGAANHEVDRGYLWRARTTTRRAGDRSRRATVRFGLMTSVLTTRTARRIEADPPHAPDSPLQSCTTWEAESTNPIASIFAGPSGLIYRARWTTAHVVKFAETWRRWASDLVEAAR